MRPLDIALAFRGQVQVGATGQLWLAWLQVTVDSLLGNHGQAPQSSGEALLRAYPDTVLATDAHNLRRCSGLSAGYAWVGEQLGPERAEGLRARAERVLAALVGRAS